MIDTVAKAIMKWCVPFNDWDAITESQREQFRDAARIVIPAMRVPTGMMLERGRDAIYDCAVHDGHGGVETMPPIAVWEAMIDAAITPTDG